MGLEFGELPIRIRRIAYYGLSPLEQRVWAKSISHGIPNLLNRAIRVVLIVVPRMYLYQNLNISFINETRI